MNFLNKTLASALLAGFAALSQAHSFDVGAIHVGHPWARPTAPGQPVGGGYLSLKNSGNTPDRLLSASAEVAKSVELHTMSMDGNVMRMREVAAIDVPAGQTVTLQPGGLHIMFMGLTAPLKAGDKFPMTLTFEKAGKVQVTVNVEQPKSGEAGKDAKHDHKHDHKH